MRNLLLLFVCCLLCVMCQTANTRRWKAKKHRWSMAGFTNVTWTSLINGAQISERAIYKNNLNVVFMFSRDENLVEPYRKSFFIYDVDANLGAISVEENERKFCFITDMDEAKTIVTVKEDLSVLNNTVGTEEKPVRSLYVSTDGVQTVEQLLPRSNMISAICSKAANCNNAYMVTTEATESEVKAIWKTSSLYHLNDINFLFDPTEQRSSCRRWTNYWTRFSKGQRSRRQ